LNGHTSYLLAPVVVQGLPVTANHPVSQTTLDQARGQALKTGETINVPDLASEITECLADLIVCSASLEEQPRLVAHIVEQPGRFVTEKREAGVGAQLFADLPEVGNEQVCTRPGYVRRQNCARLGSWQTRLIYGVCVDVLGSRPTTRKLGSS
jgi:hypothetical protein